MMATLQSGEGVDLSQMMSSQTETRNHMKTKDRTVDKSILMVKLRLYHIDALLSARASHLSTLVFGIFLTEVSSSQRHVIT